MIDINKFWKQMSNPGSHKTNQLLVSMVTQSPRMKSLWISSNTPLHISIHILGHCCHAGEVDYHNILSEDNPDVDNHTPITE